MKVELKIPSFGESVVEATIGAIFKPSGTQVAVDEEILELETDKLNQSLHAPASGQLELFVKSGDVVKVGQIIGSIDDASQGKSSTASSPKKEPSSPKIASTPSRTAEPKKQASPLPSARKTVDEALSESKAPAAFPPSVARDAPPPPRTVGRETRQKMTKLRRIIAKKLVEVKNQTAMLTTFNELDMSAILQVREK